MKFKDIKNLSVPELRKKKKEITENLFQAKMKNSLGQLGSPTQIRAMRRSLAKIETALKQAKK